MTPKSVRQRKPSLKNRARQRRAIQPPTEPEGVLAALEARLQRRRSITFNGEAKQLPAAEAIVLQLFRKALKGETDAMATLLEYVAFAGGRSNKRPVLHFLENNYERSNLNSSLSETDE